MLSDSNRAEAAYSSVLYIRDWFGCKGNKTSQETAGAAYKSLYAWALLSTKEGSEMTVIEQKEVYGNNEELIASSYESDDLVDGIALGTPGSLPGYAVTALMHCPDSLGSGSSLWDETTMSETREDEMSRNLEVPVFMTDRQACEEGWVLQLAINRREKVLRFRYRCKANKACIHAASW